MQPGPSSVEGRAGSRAGQHVLCVKGPMTLTTAPAFQDAVRSVAAPCLIIDLSEVPYIDSSAMGALVQAYVSCQKAGRRLALVGLSHRVKAVLQITGLAPLFHTYGTLSEAEQGLA